jgi:uncharacterized protein YgiM (DUF1202 family)
MLYEDRRTTGGLVTPSVAKASAPASLRPVVRWLLIAAFAVLAASGAGLPAAAQTTGLATVTSSDGLNLRAGPSGQAQVVTVIPFASVVTLTGQSTSDGWYPVTFGSSSGWADGQYLTQGSVDPNTAQNAPPLVKGSSSSSLSSGGSTATSSTSDTSGSSSASASNATTALLTLQLTTMFVNTDGLNLRATPGTGGQIETTMPQGAVVQVTGAANANDWLPVTYNGTSGWCDATYLSSASQVSSDSLLSSLTSAVGGAAPMNSSNGSAASTTSVSTTPLSAAEFGSPSLGTQAGPPITGLTVATAPTGTLGKLIWPVDSRAISTIFQPAHQAVDIDQFPSGGNPVRSIADGIVTYVGTDASAGYGLYVIVQHTNGLSSLYAHFSKIDVSLGQLVHQSQQLGLSGCTGDCTGPHVHFAIFYNGDPLDPLTVLPSGAKIEAGANCYGRVCS